MIKTISKIGNSQGILVFLRLNGFTLAPDGDDWENLTLAVAAGAMSRDDATAALRRLVK